MTGNASPISDQITTGLHDLGQTIRMQRKSLRISATAVAEVSGISRVTLHRIEKGESSVTMGAWFSVIANLGLRLQAIPNSAIFNEQNHSAGWIPTQIPLSDFPQLRALCWHISGLATISPIEALEIYERNTRHLDMSAMSEQEQTLLQDLKKAFLRNHPDV